jgi:hypothetical protein
MLPYLLGALGLGFALFPKFFQASFLRINKDTWGEKLYQGKWTPLYLRLLGFGFLFVAAFTGDALPRGG